MMNNLYVFLVLGVSVFLFSCGADDSLVALEDQELIEVTPEVESDLTVSKGSKLLNESGLFSESNFGKVKILDTLFLSIHSSVQDGFALMCKFDSVNKKVLKTYVFDRNSDGELIHKNTFNGILLGKDTLVNDYPRLMMRFVERYGKGDLYSYNCWFGFDRNIDKYVFDHCISINKTYEDRRNSLDVYFSEVESIADQLMTDKQVLSVLEENNFLN
ncbi:MAG: hypothetical protein QNK70_04980 [Crocinitomicaceae bacterium]